ncbi:MAG: ThiF family adenylyltransferase [Paludibacteraceae bacterium]
MFSRTIQAIGEEAFARLQSVRVILFGVGGVGGWCAEALVRTGVQHLTIVDFDTVAPSNLNRQVVATAANIGRTKVEEMRARLLAINPQADITALPLRYDTDTADRFEFNQYDYVLDAIDSLDCKMLLIRRATLSTATLFSSMGAARKYDPARIEVAEFWKVHGCPLARALRTRMKKADMLPAKKFLCAFSPEISAAAGTLAPVVGTFGFRLAAEVVKDILTPQRPHNS